MESTLNNVNRRDFMRLSAMAGAMAAALTLHNVQAEEKPDDIPFTKENLLIALQPDEKTVEIISEFVASLDVAKRADLKKTLSTALERGDLVQTSIKTITTHEKLNEAFQNEVALKWPKWLRAVVTFIWNDPPWWAIAGAVVIIAACLILL